jgi:hypothetical protein
MEDLGRVVEFKFSIGQSVHHDLRDITGYVIGLFVNRGGLTMIEVEWKEQDGGFKSCYFWPSELNAV